MPALNHFGLDIGTHSIKTVQLGGQNTRPVFIAAGQVPTPTHSGSRESEHDTVLIAETITKLQQQANISKKK